MAQGWDRETHWRQGHLLSKETFGKLFASEKSGGYSNAIVISHDCDLAAPVDDEPKIELLLCRFLPEIDGNFAASKNSRRLHIALQNSLAKTVLDIRAIDKLQINKLDLLNQGHNSELLLTREELRIFQLWLSDRYARSSFSNDFNDFFKHKKFRDSWMKIIGPLGETLQAIYFDVDDTENFIRTNGDPPIELVVFLRYSLSSDEKGIAKATQASEAITALFRKTFYEEKNGCWKGIELKFCSAVSDEALSVAEHQKLRIWDTAYLSLRADPQQSVVKR